MILDQIDEMCESDAAYRHFADKAALLAAIREAGFAQFADALEQARAKAGKTFSSRLKAMAVAYVRFAAEHPAHFEVMFSWTPHQPAPPSPARARAFGILEQTIREGQQSGDVRPGDSTVLARLVLGGGSCSRPNEARKFHSGERS